MLKTKFGGGGISPAVMNHLKKRTGQTSPAASTTTSKAQLGGGGISPAVVAHIAKRNIAKK
jgi:hypothetical protein